MPLLLTPDDIAPEFPEVPEFLRILALVFSRAVCITWRKSRPEPWGYESLMSIAKSFVRRFCAVELRLSSVNCCSGFPIAEPVGLMRPLNCGCSPRASYSFFWKVCCINGLVFKLASLSSSMSSGYSSTIISWFWAMSWERITTISVLILRFFVL